MRLDIAAQSDTGRRKKKNEDSYGVFREGDPNIQLFRRGAMLCVADGLGGHGDGDIASKLAVSLVRDMLKTPPPPPNPDLTEDEQEGPLPVLRMGIQRTNESIFQTNIDHRRNNKPMGTTLLTAIVESNVVYIGNVGDSRCYHLRDGNIIARTEDHSWVDEQVKLGLMSKAEAEIDSRKNIVTRCIGTHPEIDVDTYKWHLVPGDMLLLCSDGLVNMVTDADIKDMFSRNYTVAEIAHQLVTLANENGGKDNITVIVANISPFIVRRVYLRIRSFIRRHGFTMTWILFLLLYGIAAFAGGYFTQMFWPLELP